MPLLDRPAIVAASLAYFALVLALGLWSLRRTKSAADFFVAGRRLGLPLMVLATMSSAFSGFAFVGGPGLTYRLGAVSFFIILPVGFTAALLAWGVGKRLRLLAEVREVFTLSDAIACRWPSRLPAGLAAVAVLIGTVGYLGAQLQALGVLLEAVFGTRAQFGEWSLPVAMAAGLTILLAYSAVGGMVAGVWTDVLQGLLMLATGVAIFASAVDNAGGWALMLASVADSPQFGEHFLDPLAAGTVFTAFGFFFVFGVGVLGQPHLVHKFFMLRDPEKLRWLPLTLAGSQVLALLMWVGLGLAVPALVAQGRLAPLAQPDLAAPSFLLNLASPALAGLAVAGIFGAIMSTADSLANIAAAAAVRDLPRAWGFRLRRELAWGRVATVAMAIAAGLLSWAYDDLIARLGTFAFGIFAAALAPVLAVGWAWRRISAGVASASIATGLAASLGLELLARRPGLAALGFAPGVLPAAVALAASFTVLIAGGLLAPRAEPLPPEIEALVES